MRAIRIRHPKALILLFAICSYTFLIFILRCGSSIEDVKLISSFSDYYHPHQYGELSDNEPQHFDAVNVGVLVQSTNSMEEHLDLAVLSSSEKKQLDTKVARSVSEEVHPSNSDSADLLAGLVPVVYNNEFEVVPFTRFTMDRLYPVEPGLGRRVIEKPIGFRKLEIIAALDRAIAALNENNGRSKLFSLTDFIEGLYRSIPSVGTQYELFFRDGKHYRRIQVVQPNAAPVVHHYGATNDHTKKVHVILALSERTDSFRRFMERFEQLLHGDHNLLLTVVYFGNVGLTDVRLIIGEFEARYSIEKVHLILAAGSFSRARGLQLAADSIAGNALLFMCDVDIVFTSSFVERCRLHTVSGQSVYYPIVFSLYNPSIVSSLQGNINQLSVPPVISRDTGFWRDFGYGMTCQYRNDFKRVGGFDVNVSDESAASGWGMEDVRLYRRHLQSGFVVVVRATDPAIFHIWHEKHCDPNLPADQYNGCLRSRALSEASQSQLGQLLLKKRDSTSRRSSIKLSP